MKRKILAALLSAAMLTGLCGSVFAAEGDVTPKADTTPPPLSELSFTANLGAPDGAIDDYGFAPYDLDAKLISKSSAKDEPPREAGYYLPFQIAFDQYVEGMELRIDIDVYENGDWRTFEDVWDGIIYTPQVADENGLWDLSYLMFPGIPFRIWAYDENGEKHLIPSEQIKGAIGEADDYAISLDGWDLAGLTGNFTFTSSLVADPNQFGDETAQKLSAGWNGETKVLQLIEADGAFFPETGYYVPVFAKAGGDFVAAAQDGSSSKSMSCYFDVIGVRDFGPMPDGCLAVPIRVADANGNWLNNYNTDGIRINGIIGGKSYSIAPISLAGYTLAGQSGGNTNQGGSSSSSGSSSGESASSTREEAPAAVTTSQATASAQQAIDKALAADENATAVTVKVRNADSISAAALRAIASVAALASADKDEPIAPIVHADVVKDGKVESRLYIDPTQAPSNAGEIKLGVTLGDQKVEEKFDRFFDNKVAVVKFDQAGSFGMTIKAAVKLDLTGFNTRTLHFYSYDAKTNTYSRITAPAYYVDANGYLHFTTSVGNNVIITDKPLARK